MSETGLTPEAGAPPRQVLRFLGVGGVSYVVDAGLLWVLARPVGLPLAVATTVAFATSFVVNFSGNRWIVFPGGGPAGRQVLRYAVVVLVTYLGTLAVVLEGTHLGAPLLVAKTVAVVLSAGFNFVVGRRWVYR